MAKLGNLRLSQAKNNFAYDSIYLIPKALGRRPGRDCTCANLPDRKLMRSAEAYHFDGYYPETAPFQNTAPSLKSDAAGLLEYSPVPFPDSVCTHTATNDHKRIRSIVFETDYSSSKPISSDIW